MFVRLIFCLINVESKELYKLLAAQGRAGRQGGAEQGKAERS